MVGNAGRREKFLFHETVGVRMEVKQKSGSTCLASIEYDQLMLRLSSESEDAISPLESK